MKVIGLKIAGLKIIKLKRVKRKPVSWSPVFGTGLPVFGTGSPAFWTSLAVLWIFLILGVVSSVEARSSAAWRERLEARTATLWIDGQALEGIVLNARGELNVTWVGRDLIRPLDQDRDVEEWLVSALGYYFSNRKDTRAKVKGRDVFVLNYRAVKYWNFDATRLVVDGYAITPDDILTKKEYWQDGELPPGYMGTVAVAAPSPKPGRKIELRFEDAQAILEVPRR